MLVADIAHIAGLVAGGAHPSPVGHRRRRLDDHAQDAARAARRHDHVQEGARPGDRQGRVPGPAGRAAQPHHRRDRGRAERGRDRGRFKTYAHADRRERARRSPQALVERGFDLVTGGTDNHLILIDLDEQERAGKVAAQALDRAGIVLNYNAVPFDPRKPFDPSGIRIGTPAVTCRGMGTAEMKQLADFIDRAIDGGKTEDEAALGRILAEVTELTRRFRAPGL